MPSTASEIERTLDRAVELLLMPSLDNLRAVEELFRDAIVHMPTPAGDVIARKVRLCSRLLDGAEAARPGGEPAGSYTAYGERLPPRSARLLVDA